MLAGVPAARPADWHNSFPQWTHAVEDTDDEVPVAWLQSNALIYSRLLLKLLTDPGVLPARRNSSKKIKELVQRDGAAEALRWQVLLPSH
jgi:hypothetical protein